MRWHRGSALVEPVTVPCGHSSWRPYGQRCCKQQSRRTALQQRRKTCQTSFRWLQGGSLCNCGSAACHHMLCDTNTRCRCCRLACMRAQLQLMADTPSSCLQQVGRG